MEGFRPHIQQLNHPKIKMVKPALSFILSLTSCLLLCHVQLATPTEYMQMKEKNNLNFHWWRRERIISGLGFSIRVAFRRSVKCLGQPLKISNHHQFYRKR